MDDKYIVYKHIAPNNKSYIGITKRHPKDRWRNGNGYKNNIYFFRAIQKYGWDNFEHKILLRHLTKEQAEYAEKLFIEYWNLTNPLYGYNLESGGNLRKECSDVTRQRMSKAHIGKHLSLETRQKLSEARRGEKNPMYGKPSPMHGKHLTEEHRHKISKAQRGEKNHMYGKRYNHTEETKRKISMKLKGKNAKDRHPLYGKHHSMQTKKKMSNAAIDRKRMTVALDKQTSNIMFICESISDASRWTGISATHISACCRGKRKSAGGYIWRYA